MPTSGATDGRILVTGATGLAGAAVIREFIRNRHPVRALVRSRAKARAFEAFPTVGLVEGDMTRPETLEDALSGVDRVLLISSPDLREAPTILTQGALLLPLEDAKLVPVDVADIAKAAVALLTTPGHEAKIYAMSGPEALSMAEIAEQISRAIGKAVRYVPITREARRQALLAAGVPPFSVDALDAQAGERLRGTEATVHLETHAALGIAPTPFAEFARRHAGAFLGESVYIGLG